MFLNISGKIQGVQNKYLEYKSICPNEIVSEEVFPSVKLLGNQFKKVTSIPFEKGNRILFRRGHALGDIIMLFPIINHLKGNGKKVFVYTNTAYTIKGCNCILDIVHFNPEDYDLIVDLDWVVEIDHYDKKYFSVNRVDIYKKYLGLKNIGNDWSVNYPKMGIDTNDAIVGIQTQGSTASKTISVLPIMEELDKKGTKFYIIDNTNKYANRFKNGVCVSTDVVGLLNIFGKLKGVLTFDSGPLWLSHVTNTPAFVVVGPTCGKKITSRHPNCKTMYYDTKIDCGCMNTRGCGESGLYCHKKYDCLSEVNYERFKKEFNVWLERL